MEPLDDNELNQLLRRWKAPPAPPSLRARIFPPQKSSWRWLLTGTIRVPVPIVVAIAVLLAFLIQYVRPASPPRVVQSPTVSLADFKAVPQLEPVLVSGGQK